jgi:O-antigen/teichoic acid export membrane protein
VAELEARTGVQGPGPVQDAPQAGSLFAALTSGAALMVLTRFTMRSLGLVSAAILARLLRPEDFGLVAIALSLIGGLEALSVFGTNLAIIREGEAGRELYDTAWTVEVLRGLFLAGALVLLAAPAAGFFGEPRVRPLLMAVALAAVIQGVENVGVVDFTKSLRFKMEFALFLGAKAASFVVVVAAAFALRDHWALVLGYLAQRAARTTLSYVMHPYRPRLSLAAWRRLFSFTGWMWAYNLVAFANTQGLILVGARLVDPRVLGFLKVGSEVGSLPLSEIQAPMLRVLFPGFSRVGDDRGRLTRLFSDAFATMLLVQTAISVGLALAADPFVRFVYGGEWRDMAPLVALVALSTLFQLPGTLTENSLLASGRIRLFCALFTGSALVRVPALALGLAFGGLAGAGWAMLGSYVIDAAIFGLALNRLCQAGPAPLAGAWRTAASAAAMCAAVEGLRAIMPSGDGTASAGAELAAIVLAGGAAFAACQGALWRLCGSPDGPEANLLRFVRAQAPGLAGGGTRRA